MLVEGLRTARSGRRKSAGTAGPERRPPSSLGGPPRPAPSAGGGPAFVAAVSSDTEVVTAQVTTDGPDRDPIVKITPVGLGTTTVEITGSTANGSASYTWEITVVAPG